MTFDADALDTVLEEFNMGEDGEAISDEAPFWGETGYDAIAELDEPFDVEVNGETVRVKVLDTSFGTYQDDTYIIFEVEGRTFRKFGWTASHDGTYWEGSCNEVRPVEKTITVWETL